jgi:hypothetical protein
MARQRRSCAPHTLVRQDAGETGASWRRQRVHDIHQEPPRTHKKKHQQEPAPQSQQSLHPVSHVPPPPRLRPAGSPARRPPCCSRSRCPSPAVGEPPPLMSWALPFFLVQQLYPTGGAWGTDWGTRGQHRAPWRASTPRPDGGAERRRSQARAGEPQARGHIPRRVGISPPPQLPYSKLHTGWRPCSWGWGCWQACCG